MSTARAWLSPSSGGSGLSKGKTQGSSARRCSGCGLLGWSAAGAGGRSVGQLPACAPELARWSPVVLGASVLVRGGDEHQGEVRVVLGRQLRALLECRYQGLVAGAAAVCAAVPAARHGRVPGGGGELGPRRLAGSDAKSPRSPGSIGR